MRRLFGLLSLFPLFALLSVGCSFNIDGDWTDGEAGRTRWQLDDGLCPGLGGGCALDVPLALGANTSLTVEVPNRNVDTLSVSAEGGVASIRSTNPDSDLLYLDLEELELGEVAVRVHAGDSDPFDQVRVQVRQPGTLRCGQIRGDGAVQYTMRAMVPTDSVSVLYATAGSDSPNAQLACLVADVDGRPLLSADAIHWTVASGLEHMSIHTGLELLATPEADGARIYIEPRSTGTTEVTAQLGDLSETITVTIID